MDVQRYCFVDMSGILLTSLNYLKGFPINAEQV